MNLCSPLRIITPSNTLAIFPSSRNRVKLRRIAASAAASRTPENTVRATLDRARTSLVRKGLPDDLIRKDIGELECALRGYLAEFLGKQGVAT